MKAIKIKEFGGPEVLRVVQLADPSPEHNEVLIQVKACGVGTVDVLFRKGLYPGLGLPDFIPGVEVAGIVIAIGESTDKKWLGKHVFAITVFGGYAEKVAVSETKLVEIPDSLTATQAISLGVNALVASLSLDRAGLCAGDSVLIRGAGGGIGSVAAQLALTRQYEVTVVNSSPQKRVRLETLGLSKYLSQEDFNKAGNTFQAIIDPVGGNDLDLFVNMLGENGKYILNGMAGGLPATDFGMSWLQRFQKSLTFSCLSLDSISPDDIRENLSSLLAMVKMKKLEPLVAALFPLEEASMAHQSLEAGDLFGKVVLITEETSRRL